jgi:hypothetical protein
MIRGPQDSPYEGGVFELELFLPEEYPMAAPKVSVVSERALHLPRERDMDRHVSRITPRRVTRARMKAPPGLGTPPHMRWFEFKKEKKARFVRR